MPRVVYTDDVIEHVIAHTLPLSRARALADRAIAEYAARFAHFSPKVTWTHEHLAQVSVTAKGLQLNGEVHLEPQQLRLRFQVPFLLRPFRGRAIERIESEVRTWLARAEAGEV